MNRSAGGMSFAFAWAVAGLALAGCSSKPPPKREPPVEVYLRRLVQAYDVAEYKLGRPPRNEDELKRFLGETGATEDPEQLLVSPRDGQKYVVYYGRRLDPYGSELLAHEKDGADGTRYAITLSRDVRVLSDDEFARKYPDKVQKSEAK
jgi:hypothetical protein